MTLDAFSTYFQTTAAISISNKYTGMNQKCPHTPSRGISSMRTRFRSEMVISSFIYLLKITFGTHAAAVNTTYGTKKRDIFFFHHMSIFLSCDV